MWFPRPCKLYSCIPAGEGRGGQDRLQRPPPPVAKPKDKLFGTQRDPQAGRSLRGTLSIGLQQEGCPTSVIITWWHLFPGWVPSLSQHRGQTTGKVSSLALFCSTKVRGERTRGDIWSGCSVLQTRTPRP